MRVEGHASVAPQRSAQVQVEADGVVRAVNVREGDVVKRGAVLAEGPYEEVSRNPQVMEAYMGTTDGQLQGAH